MYTNISDHIPDLGGQYEIMLSDGTIPKTFSLYFSFVFLTADTTTGFTISTSRNFISDVRFPAYKWPILDHPLVQFCGNAIYRQPCYLTSDHSFSIPSHTHPHDLQNSLDIIALSQICIYWDICYNVAAALYLWDPQA